MSGVTKVNQFLREDTTLYYSELEDFNIKSINAKSKGGVCILKLCHVSLKKNTNLYINCNMSSGQSECNKVCTVSFSSLHLASS